MKPIKKVGKQNHQSLETNVTVTEMNKWSSSSAVCLKLST